MLSLQIVNHIGDANIGLPLDFMLVKIIKKTQKIRKQLQKKKYLATSIKTIHFVVYSLPHSHLKAYAR